MISYQTNDFETTGWIISETKFSPNHLNKFESIFSLGNGYMGLRASTEEAYFGEKRNWFVNGTFNKADPTEVTELPNLPDVTQLDIYVDGERFHLEVGQANTYIRRLNLKTAELSRYIEWTSPNGKKLKFTFKRFVSLKDKHLIGMKLEVENVGDSVDLSIASFINGQVTNSGAQHFLNGIPRIHKDTVLEYKQTTRESNVDVIIHSHHQLKQNGKNINPNIDKLMERRKVGIQYNLQLQQNDKIELEKLTTVYTSRDYEYKDNYSYELMHLNALEELNRLSNIGYEQLFQQHVDTWDQQVWKRYNVALKSENDFDILAIRFSIYHLIVMTPMHDERMGIAAKGLSGEGYKGHSFWDTEIFILPFFTYTNPEVAKKLLMYRYLGLDSARKKAIENGYRGAMYPWETAFPTDGEVTPEYGDIDIVTGERSKIWTGLIEQHITADIAFAVYQYVQMSNDQSFLDQYGYEIVFETAKFWCSRFEWQEDKSRYEIHNVIGPDEYKEHVNNNAYTNYLSYFNVKLAIYYYKQLKEKNEQLFDQLNEKLDLQSSYKEWVEKVEQLYLPQPNEDGIIPQDDTYLQLKVIDLTKYKNQTQFRTIYKDYNQEQINKIQVTKQADVLVLIYLLEQTFLKNDIKFNEEIKRINFDFYESRTLHDSSLSLSTHAILANDIGQDKLAYSLFQKLCEIDLGPNMKSSRDGIHAAAIAGIWSVAVFGFSGFRLENNKLLVNPKLPEKWEYFSFDFKWQGKKYNISIDQEKYQLTAILDEKFNVIVNGEVNQYHHSLVMKIGTPLFLT